MLEETRNACILAAKKLGEYQKMTVDELATGYCVAKDTGDENGKNMYISALLLRFWHKIDKLNRSCPNIGLSYEDFFCWLYEAIEYACKYRAWMNPDKHVNAQQAINKCIETIRVQKYYDMNLDKHKMNYGLASLDDPLGNSDDEVTVGDLVPDESTEDDFAVTGWFDARSIIQKYVRDGRLVDAIIADTVAFNAVPAMKRTKRVVKTKTDSDETLRYTEYSSEFWPYLLVKTLNNLPANYSKYFVKHYGVDEVSFSAALEKLKAANNQKIYRYIARTTESLKKLIFN